MPSDISVGKDIIVDHCSASWSLDEVLSSLNQSDPTLTRVTVQWCFITEGLNPDNHGFGSLIRGTGGAKYSYLHNLYAQIVERNPRPGNYDPNPHNEDPEGLLLDFRNNVIYNWGGEHAGYNADSKKRHPSQLRRQLSDFRSRFKAKRNRLFHRISL